MSNKKKTPLVPKLRFPEFEQSWDKIPLGKLGQFFRGLTYGADDVANEGLLVLRSSNIQGGQLILDTHLVFVKKQCPPELRLKRGDIAICMSNGSKALVGKSGELGKDYPGELTVGAFCSIFRPTKQFAKIAFSTPRYDKFVATGIAGGNINNLKNSDLEAFEFHVPSSEREQQKVADCLSSLDELIAAQARKVNALKTHKKGLMQQLFPREGETQPRLRFPEFRGTTAWKKVTAGQSFTNRVERGSSSLPIYSVTMTDGMVPRASLDRRIDDIAETSANKAVRKGDIAYNMMRMWQGALGVAPEDCMVSPAYIVLKPKAANTIFFSYLLKLPQMLQVLTAHSRGLTEDRLRLYYDDFANVPLLCPSVEEQKRIANCLTSVDKLIAARTQELETLKTHKKGLMQQLFPSPEAVEA